MLINEVARRLKLERKENLFGKMFGFRLQTPSCKMYRPVFGPRPHLFAFPEGNQAVIYLPKFWVSHSSDGGPAGLLFWRARFI